MASDEMNNVTVSNINFNDGLELIFDELGGPVADLTTDAPGNGGSFRITGVDATYDIVVAPFTGRVTVVRTDVP